MRDVNEYIFINDPQFYGDKTYDNYLKNKKLLEELIVEVKRVCGLVVKYYEEL